MKRAGGHASGRDDESFWLGIAARIRKERVPLSGSVDLTSRCNLDCVHCYVRQGPGMPQQTAELSTGQWLKILAEIAEAGCLDLLISGGEPLLRDDFLEIYSFAKRRGFLVTVFTNGTLVGERTVDLFKELPPRLVEISLYGASEEVQDRITRVPGSFQKTMQGIERLLAAGVPLRLKSVLMTLNSDGFPAIETLARGLGVKFRFDPAIFPTLAGDHAPVDLRVSPERAVEQEMAEPGMLEEWRDFLGPFRGLADDGFLFNCGSGVNTFHVDAQGRLFPCLMVRKDGYPLMEGSFNDGWSRGFDHFREEIATIGMPCRGCGEKLLCGYCPGFFEMENGDRHVPSPYLCAIGKRRGTWLDPGTRGG
jgi:radical SAM protein with 4Fe4S-binding SPASM domain